MILPEEFLEKAKSFPDFDIIAYLKAIKQPPSKGLRVNTGKICVADFLKISPFSLFPNPLCGEGFIVADGEPARHVYHASGLYYMQEPSAMSAVPMMELCPGDKVLDLCAAPGGKSTQIAAKIGEDGLLISNEIVSSRVFALSSNIERLGIRNAVVTNAAPDKLGPKLREFFDKILVDAPCSGEGMFRKDKEAAKYWSPEHSKSCALRQREILESAKEALAPGGILVYSTCTFSREENEGVIEAFLSENRDFSLVEYKRIYPQDGIGEGHFAAKLIKKGEPATGEPRGNGNLNGGDLRSNRSTGEQENGASATVYQASRFNSAARRNSPFAIAGGEEQEAVKTYHNIVCGAPYGKIISAAGHVFIAPRKMPELSGIRIVSAGVRAFSIEKGRLEPCHNLFMAADAKEIKNVINLSSESKELKAFMRGEVIPCDFSGYTAVAADGFIVGFGKGGGGVLKNKYPKGLRNFGLRSSEE